MKLTEDVQSGPLCPEDPFITGQLELLGFALAYIVRIMQGIALGLCRETVHDRTGIVEELIKC